jgi:hypothetical protein
MTINSKSRKASVEANSLGGLHHMKDAINYDFMNTQQHFPSVNANIMAANKMAHTGMGGNQGDQHMDKT